MRAVTVYRLEDGGNFSYRTRYPIGSVLEQRTDERGNNYQDLLRLARKTFALDTADPVHLAFRTEANTGGWRAGLPSE
ncbi:MAG: hypothetical protein IH577_03815 [Deltaproteobacteria bacterium]|nr:hypothetical protein [Deltaproteobacteria bacterium]